MMCTEPGCGCQSMKLRKDGTDPAAEARIDALIAAQPKTTALRHGDRDDLLDIRNILARIHDDSIRGTFLDFVGLAALRDCMARLNKIVTANTPKQTG